MKSHMFSSSTPHLPLIAAARIKLEQAEAAAKVAEKSKAGAEKKLKSAEQEPLGDVISVVNDG